MTVNIEKKSDSIKKSVVVCIPVLNEEKNIAKLILDTKKFSNKIILIDDGSSDYTSKIAKELGVEVLIHEKNLGKSAALQTGFKRAMDFSPDVVVTMDGDGQHDPSFIPSLIEPIISGKVDIVIGSRSNKTKMPKYRKIGYDVICYMNRKAINSKVRDTQSGFRAYSIKSINTIAQEKYQDYAGEFEQLGTLTQKGFEIAEVPVEIKYDGLKKNF